MAGRGRHRAGIARGGAGGHADRPQRLRRLRDPAHLRAVRQDAGASTTRRVHPLLLGVLDRVLGHYQLSARRPASRSGRSSRPRCCTATSRSTRCRPTSAPVVVNTMWALDDFTEANGATRLVPGSHRWVDRVADARRRGGVGDHAGRVGRFLPRPPVARRRRQPTPTVPAWGSSSSTWRRGCGRRRTTSSAVPPDVVATLPERLQELLGYNIYPPFLGYVDGRHPRRIDRRGHPGSAASLTVPMDDGLRAALEAMLGARLRDAAVVHGGDVAVAYRVDLVDGRRVFAKTHPAPPPGFFTTEAARPDVAARGASRRRARGRSPSPTTRRRSSCSTWIDEGRARARRPSRTSAPRLAALHRAGAPCFGREDRRTTGSRGLPNEPAATWAEFYGQCRLLPLARARPRRRRARRTTRSIGSRRWPAGSSCFGGRRRAAGAAARRSLGRQPSRRRRRP